MHTPCTSVYTVTVLHVHTTVQTTHVTIQITSICSLILYYGTTHMFLYDSQLAVRQPGTSFPHTLHHMGPSHTASHGPLTHSITWVPHTLHHMAPSHTPSHGSLTHCIIWPPHTLHHMVPSHSASHGLLTNCITCTSLH